MVYKLVLIDIDDTILPANGRISNEDIVSIKSCLEKNVKIGFISGRPNESMRRCLLEGGISKTYAEDFIIIGFNGGKIEIKDNNHLKKNLKKDVINCLVPKILELKGNAALLSDKRFFVLKIDEWAKNYNNKLNYAEIEKYLTNSTEEIFKLVVMQNPDDKGDIKKMDSYAELIGNKNPLKLIRANIQFKNTNNPCAWLEIMPYNIDKGKAIEKLQGYLRIKMNEIMVIGDGINDLEMFQLPGVFSVLMKNSNYLEKLKKYVNFVTNGIEDNPSGVSYALNKFILKSTCK